MTIENFLAEHTMLAFLAAAGIVGFLLAMKGVRSFAKLAALPETSEAEVEVKTNRFQTFVITWVVVGVVYTAVGVSGYTFVNSLSIEDPTPMSPEARERVEEMEDYLGPTAEEQEAHDEKLEEERSEHHKKAVLSFEERMKLEEDRIRARNADKLEPVTQE